MCLLPLLLFSKSDPREVRIIDTKKEKKMGLGREWRVDTLEPGTVLYSIRCAICYYVCIVFVWVDVCCISHTHTRLCSQGEAVISADMVVKLNISVGEVFFLTFDGRCVCVRVVLLLYVRMHSIHECVCALLWYNVVCDGLFGTAPHNLCNMVVLYDIV